MARIEYKNKDSYYLRSPLFNRIASDNAPKIDPVLVVEYVQTTRIGPNIGDRSNSSVAIS